MRTALDVPTEPTAPPPVAAEAPAERRAAPRRKAKKRRSPRPREINTADTKIEQRRPVIEAEDRVADNIVEADNDALDKDYIERIRFMEEPVTIEIVPSGGENAPEHYPVWVNGKGAEVWIGDRWIAITYLPVGQRLTVKRKYVAVLAAAKTDAVRTEVKDKQAENPRNVTHRNTSAVCNFTLLEDANPRGAAWLAETRRRQF